MEESHFKEPFDVIFCRNVMIYFDNPTKEILVGKFFHHLANGGYFFIGHAESLTGIKHSFCNYSGSKFRGSRLPWRDLMCIPGTIALNATLSVSTQWDR